MLNPFHFYLHITFGFIVYESVEWSVGSKPDLLERAVLGEDPLQVFLATIFIDVCNEKKSVSEIVSLASDLSSLLII